MSSKCEQQNTVSKVFIGDILDKAELSSCISFIPYFHGVKTNYDALHVSEDDWDMLHWSIRHVFPDYNMYDTDFAVTVDDWDRIMDAWQFIFVAESFDEVFECFCGLDYGNDTIRNPELIYYMNHTCDLWEGRNRAQRLFAEFQKWYLNIKAGCTHISICGL